MKDNFEHTFRHLKANVSLTDNERGLMRNHLHAHMIENPARAPFFVRMLSHTENFLGSFAQISTVWQPVGGALVVVLVGGLGTAYAAQDALPGDLLYSIKVRVNEPLRGALATSQTARAQWDASLVGKRLIEAETLATQGRLTPDVQAVVLAQLDTVTKNFNDEVELLSQSNQDDAAVAVLQTEVEATLNAHVNVLSTLNSNISTSDNGLAHIIVAAKSHAKSATVARKQTEETFSKSGDSELRAATAINRERAEDRLQKLKTHVSIARSALSASSTAEAAIAASSTEASITSADKHIEDGNFDKAFSALLDALRTEEETRINVDAATQLGHTSSPPIIDTASEHTDPVTSESSSN